MSRRRRAILCLVGAAAGALAAGAAEAQVRQRVKDTVHNLSAGGPGRVRAAVETEVCIFCHTPHGAAKGVRPLWNRSIPAGPYQIYESTSLKARPGQPTGSSKLCLSCHDGTIALGSVLSRPTPIAMGGATDRIPAGPSNLGTDLSDDHPVSFQYAASISGGNVELVPPGAIPPPVRLDEHGEVQCTSCHDAHDNSYGDFLLRRNDSGALCLGCHQPLSWRTSVHAASVRLVPPDVSLRLGAEPTTLAENACQGCHRSHGGQGWSWLLHLENVSATCLACHNGTAASNVQADVVKFSGHGIRTDGPGTPRGGTFVEGERVSCADCHDSHAVGSTEGTPAGVPASLSLVPGVDLDGSPAAVLRHEHELCFRCHGDSAANVQPILSRVLYQPNIRLQFQPTNPSFHPVGNPGSNPLVPSLIPPLTVGSVIGCGDCHDSDASRKLGGSGPAGPHGSSHRPLLALRYSTLDFTSESPGNYALCYRCHLRESILRDDSFRFHRLHVVDQRTPCSACHDPHGISSAQGTASANSHLINFDRSVALPNSAGRLEFIDRGLQSGQCYLRCHERDHNPESY